jgi:hypothetical protein
MTQKEVARSRPRKRGGVASENRSAVDTENAESEDQNMPSNLKRKNQLYFIVLWKLCFDRKRMLCWKVEPGISAFSGCRLSA